MDIFAEICMQAMQLKKTNPFRFIKRIQIIHKIIELEDLLYTKDIYTLSDIIISFYDNTSYNIKIPYGIFIKKSYMRFNLDNKFSIEYNAKRQEFKIREEDYGIYFISKEYTLPPSRIERWLTLEEKIKVLYMKVIADTAYELAERTINNNG